MPVPTDITTLSTTASSNDPSGSENANTIDDQIRQVYAHIATLRNGSVNVVAASAGAPAIAFTGDSNTGIYSPAADAIGTAAGGAVWMNASGVWRNPSVTQPSFAAYRSTNQTSGGTVIFDTELHDQWGDGYNNTTGVFTASIPGVYFFSSSCLIDIGGSRYPYIGLVYNGTSHRRGFAQTFCETGKSVSLNISATFRLDVNETVSVVISNNVAESLSANFYVDGSGVGYSIFSGHLLG